MNKEELTGSWKMFAGYPDVKLCAPQEAISPSEFTAPDGSVKILDLKPVTKVVIDASALLRISKHARDCTSGFSVFGNLTGMQIGEVVEVTCAIPTPAPNSRNRDTDETRKHQKNFNDMLAGEKFDTYVVGQYIAASLCAKALVELSSTLESLFEKADGHNPAVLLVFDPIRTGELGKLSINAYTLTREFFDFMKEKTSKKDKTMFEESDMLVAKKVNEAGILREVPVEIRASALFKMTLHQVELQPLESSGAVANSLIAEQYLEELLNKTSMNCEQVRRAVVNNNKLEQLLLLEQLKKQTTQLMGLCDGILLNASLTESVQQ